MNYDILYLSPLFTEYCVKEPCSLSACVELILALYFLQNVCVRKDMRCKFEQQQINTAKRRIERQINKL